MSLVRRFYLAGLLAVSVTSLPTPAQAPSAVSVASSYDTVLSRFESQFVAVAQAMPADKYGFTPESLNLSQADFVGVRTFASEVKHVAEMNFVIYSVMSGLKPDIDMDGIKSLKRKDEILTALTRSFEFGHRAVATLTAENAGEVPADSHGMTRAGIAAYVMVHDADHYGQITEYLRMCGIVPPQSRK